MMEHRKDAIYDVEISSLAGTLVSLKGASYDVAYSVCKALQESTQDEKMLDLLNSAMRSFGFGGGCGHGYSVNISAGLPQIETGEKQTCRSRMTNVGPWEKEDGLDTWIIQGKDKCCSFCGSLHPDRVLELVKLYSPHIIEFAKGYRWYVRQPDVPNASFGGIKYYRWHDTEAFVEEFNQLLARGGAGEAGK